jgi:uncharacterized membrane protein HdeD (DUF308 family)
MIADAPSEFGDRTPPVWLCLLLGIALIITGMIVLGNVVLATLVSAFFIGFIAITGGLFQIVHAFWSKGWGGFIWQILLGLLYIAAGIVLVQMPVVSILALTWALGAIFVASGLVRIFLGIRHWADAGWLLLLSGMFGVAAGYIVLSGWPATGLWVIGLLLGIDLIFAGVGWLSVAWRPAKSIAPPVTAQEA